ncbi:transcription termination factor MTEF1, chloroplastic-like [Aristolochia californica]|uniref:transcription termination factor MTEF1, chloroplastic-like n=1 Tax=Aristolochia californica TaxID=171875 RepID=UPI0035E358EE
MPLRSLPSPIVSSFSGQIPKTSYNLLSSSHPPRLLRFKISRGQNLRYLRNLGIISADPAKKPPSPESVNRFLYVVNFLKTKGLYETHFPRLSFLCPGIFHSDTDDIESVFTFLSQELGASPEESSGLIYRCPKILLSSVDLCLRPTLHFLQEVGVKKLNSANTLNAHLLNTRVEKLVEKIWFLESLGFSEQESTRVCARLPAIFGYSVENNLTPKFEYLVMEMERTLEELKAFPQYFAFSLKKRIVPRHLHLKERGVKVQLNRMLVWSDQRFYAKWK